MTMWPAAFFNSETVKTGWACKCPRCKTGDLYQPGLSINLRDQCDRCGLDFTKNDSADGPAVLLIFILGSLLVPLALIVDARFGWPLWLQAALWSAVAVLMTLGALRPLKAYIIALHFKHRAPDWE